MKTKLALWIVFIVFSTLNLGAQIPIYSNSGQKLMKDSKGEWSSFIGKDSIYNPKISEYNYEHFNVEKYQGKLDDNILSACNEILTAARYKEVKDFNLLYKTTEKLKVVNDNLKNADRRKTDILKSIQKRLQKQQKKERKEYKKSSAMVVDIMNIPSAATKSQEKLIKKYANKLRVDVSGYFGQEANEKDIDVESMSDDMSFENINDKDEENETILSDDQVEPIGEFEEVSTEDLLEELKTIDNEERKESEKDKVKVSKGELKMAKKLESLKNCDLRLDNMDGKRRTVAMAMAPFFSYTSEALVHYFKEKDMLKAEVSIVRDNKDYYLDLEVRIISRDAAKNYGSISSKSMLRIDFVNGRVLTLYNMSDTQAIIENYTGEAVYKPRYRLSKDDLSFFEKMPLNSAGIMWTSGFETYDIYNVDVLMNQSKCLNLLK